MKKRRKTMEANRRGKIIAKRKGSNEAKTKRKRRKYKKVEIQEWQKDGKRSRGN